MSVRYAILWDLDDAEGTKADPHAAVPCGLVVDRGDYVQVRLPGDGWGLKERWDDPFDEWLPDGSRQVLAPGHPDYFDRVLASLFYTFAITEPGRSGAGSSAAVVGLHEEREEE